MSDDDKHSSDSSTSENKDSVKAIVISSAPRYKKQKLWLTTRVALIIILVLLLGLLWYAHSRHNHQKATASIVTVCTDKSNITTLTQAAGAIYTNNLLKQQQAVAKLEEIPDYQKDPNCLYALVAYYINASDAKNASTYLSDFNKVYNTKRPLSGVFVNPKSPAVLKANITFIEQRAKDTQQNILKVSNPGNAQ